MTRVTMKKKVWLECSKCKGTEFSISKTVNTFGKTWTEQVYAETMCHSGCGWELDDFDFICNKCGSKDVEVTWKHSKKELKEKRTTQARQKGMGFIIKALVDIVKKEHDKPQKSECLKKF